jgi:hypothetical protein
VETLMANLPIICSLTSEALRARKQGLLSALLCRFLRFTITVEPDEGAVILDLTGPPGTREFVAALLEL